MRIFMRILLTLYILCVLFIAGVTLACAWGIIDIIHPQYWVAGLYSNTAVGIIVSIIGLALIALSIVLMFSGVRKRGAKAALIQETGTGAISISLSAIEEMSTRHILANPAIRNVKVSVLINEAKVTISAKLAVLEDTRIPDVLHGLQTSLKEHVEVLSGIEVNKISLLVEKTSQVVKARVE